jgi:hypothetical protein
MRLVRRGELLPGSSHTTVKLAAIRHGPFSSLDEAPTSAGRAMRRLTFELSGRQRHATAPGPVKMYRVPPARARWHAVGAPLERGVRPHCVGASTAIVMRETQVS